MARKFVMLTLTLFSATAIAAQSSGQLHFDHFTFAVLWQPGLCKTHFPLASPACKITSPKASINRQWTLHGLWAGLPKEWKASGLKQHDWWKYGCYWKSRKTFKSFCDYPKLQLDPVLARQLRAQMPDAQNCLDQHEFFKHANCFGFKQNAFFNRALVMLKRFNQSSFTSFVRSHRGQSVSQQALRDAFKHSFHLQTSDALELRCAKDLKSGMNDVLIQLWMTIKKTGVNNFPRADSFLSRNRRGNCKGTIQIAGFQ